MAFNEFGASTSLNDVIANRRNDVAVVNDILTRTGRNRTGKRSLPSAYNDVISGDKIGDYLYSATERYELQNHDSVPKWARWTQSTSF